MKQDDQPPEFIKPKTVLQLSDEQLELEIAARQKRRLAAFLVYQETEAKAKASRDEKLRARVERELAGFNKDLAAIDKKLSSLRDRANKIRGIRLELGDPTFNIHEKVDI